MKKTETHSLDASKKLRSSLSDSDDSEDSDDSIPNEEDEISSSFPSVSDSDPTPGSSSGSKDRFTDHNNVNDDDWNNFTVYEEELEITENEAEEYERKVEEAEELVSLTIKAFTMAVNTVISMF